MFLTFLYCWQVSDFCWLLSCFWPFLTVDRFLIFVSCWHILDLSWLLIVSDFRWWQVSDFVCCWQVSDFVPCWQVSDFVPCWKVSDFVPCWQAQRGSIQQDELTTQEKAALTGEDQQQKITSYEEAFRHIKEATGVSDTWVWLCFTYHMQAPRLHQAQQADHCV